jgi:hypothetical protein
VLGMTTYECGSCGERHWAPMSWRLEKPDLDPGDSAFKFSREGELCTVGNHHFILANVELPHCGGEKFVWTCWVSLSDASFQRIDQRWEAADRQNDEPAIGWLSSILPTYEPSTWALKARVHQRPVGERPWVELEPTDHPLSLEQRNGIEDARLAAIYHVCSPSRRALKDLYGGFYDWLLAKFDEWDPQGIVFDGNQGEYRPEVGRIIPLIRGSQSEDDLAARIHAIFVQMFDADMAGPVEIYKPFAREIIAEWRKERGAIDSA